MIRPRIIPSLLLRGTGFVKTTRFAEPRYLGDPINILRIFNEKEVDEIVVLDIAATPNNAEPNYELLRDLAGECFMPLAYGGGIRNLDQISRILQLGVEKVVINTAAVTRPEFIREAAQLAGSQSVVASIDTKRTLFGGHEVVTQCGKIRTGLDPVELAKTLEDRGIGEILLNSIDRDGTMSGYDLRLIRRVAGAVKIPVIAAGGAGSVTDIRQAFVEGRASAAAAGSLFVYTGPYKAVLINVPSQEQLNREVFAFLEQGTRTSLPA